MDRLNKLTSYFNEKERKRLDAVAKNNKGGLPEMTVSDSYKSPSFYSYGLFLLIFSLFVLISLMKFVCHA
jgi:hypothetical protein